MSKQPYTVDHLLYEWKIRHAAYGFQIKSLDETNLDHAARLTVALAMQHQLGKCIEELESFNRPYPKKDLLEGIIRRIRSEQ